MTAHNRQLAAIMFTDIVGYTALMGRNEDRALTLLEKNRQIHKPLIEKYQGRWIKEMGDGVLAQFDSAYNAVKCAIDIQKQANENFDAKLRIGLHIGEIVVENNDIFGDGVNVASRIEGLTDPGGIYLSGAFFNAIINHADIHTRFLANVLLKNVLDPVPVYCVEEKHLPVPDKQKIKQLKKLDKADYQQTRIFRKPVFWAMVAVLLVGILTVRWWFEISVPRPVKAIAVIPFTNFTGKSDEQYFVDMMHDAVISEIAKIGGLIVKSRTSTLQFTDTRMSIPEIAKILNVDAIVESSVYKTGDSVYMVVQMIRTRPVETHIWTQTYERATRNILALYGDLAKSIALEIEVQLTPQEERQLTHLEEVDPEAYKAYLNGKFHWNKLTKADLEIAEGYFLRSLELDPNSALPYVGLARIGMGRVQMGLIPWQESIDNYYGYLDKAIELDSTHIDVYFAIAATNCWGLWNFETSRKAFEKAIQLAPNDAMARAYYAHLLCYFNEFEEAIRQGERALELDPLNNLVKGIFGMTLNNCRQYDRADTVFNNVLRIDPQNSIALSNLKTTYHMKKQYSKALEFWKKDYSHDDEAIDALESGFQTGSYEGSLKMLAELLIERSKTKFVTPWRIATLYARAGMPEASLDYLEKAFEAHDNNMPYIASDPIFDFMRDDPRFQLIEEKMNLPSK